MSHIRSLLTLLISRFVAVSLVSSALACAPEAGKPKGPPESTFVVSEYFAPSGAMGDGATPEPLLLTIHENVACKERPAGARGSCYSFEYTPGSTLWAGVYWQYPANNWGADPGLPVRGELLTKVTFQAAVAEGPERIEFVIGGIGVPRAPAEADLFPNNDQMKQLVAFDVTTEFQKFEIPVPTATTGTPITSLLGAFAWFAKYPPMSDPATLSPKTIYIDDLAYE